MSEVGKYKDILMFEVLKAFYDERGKGARYRLTNTGVTYFENILKENGNIDSIQKTLKELGMVEDIKCNENLISLDFTVKGCCLIGICENFITRNMQPLSCPIANVIMCALEQKSGLSPELLPLNIVEGQCSGRLAKIATSEVVEG
jgi:hypothetical protein